MDELSTLESLPNELLLDIFEHLSVQDLYGIFFGLNSRLTDIINSFQKLRCEQVESEQIKDSTFAHRVTALIVRHSNPIDLSRYPNLQALKLECPSQQQCNQTITQPQLKHLYIGHPVQPNDTEQLLKHIFTNGFPQLQSCFLENLHSRQSSIIEHGTILPNLSSIKIFTKHSQDLIRLLALCPNLTRLSIKFFAGAIIDLNTCKQMLPNSHTNLRTLILDSLDQMSMETIDSVLSFVPNLTFLSINNPRCQNDKINIKQIASSLHRYLPSLPKFYSQIWLFDLDTNCSNNIEAVSSLHPLFQQVRLSSGGKRLIISSSCY